MSSPQQIRLRWTSHQGTILSLFDALLSSESLVDVTLAAEGKYLKAHKVILASCSPFFQELLSLHHGEKHAIVFLKDVKYCHLQALINYMYRGEVNILQTELQSLLAVAESLQIRGLSERSLNNDPTVLATTHFLGGGGISTGSCSNQPEETIILPPIDTTSSATSKSVNTSSNSISSVSASGTHLATATTGNSHFSNSLVVTEKKKSASQSQSQSLPSSQNVQRPVAIISQRSEEKSTSISSSPSKTVAPIRLSNFITSTNPLSQDDRTKSIGQPPSGQHPSKRIRLDQGPVFRQPNTTTSSVISSPISSISTSSNTFHANSSSSGSIQIQNESNKPRQGSGVNPVPVEIPSFEIIPKAESPVVVNIDDDDEDDILDDSGINENSQTDGWAYEGSGMVEVLRGGSGEVLNQTDEERGAGMNPIDPNINYDPSILDNNINLGESPSMHQCPTCLKLYQVKGSLLRHLKYECQKPPRFRCDYCGIKFRHGFRLASHKNICKLKP